MAKYNQDLWGISANGNSFLYSSSPIISQTLILTKHTLPVPGRAQAPNARTMAAGLAVMAAAAGMALAPAEKSSEEGFYSDEIMEESP